MVPHVSVLIPWCAREEISSTLAANDLSFSGSAVEILILNCSGDSDRLSELIAESGVQCVRQLNISTPTFNKSLALNVGLHYARAPLVFTLDADVILLCDRFTEMSDALNHNSFVTTEWVYESAHANAESAGLSSLGMINTFTARMVATGGLDFYFRDGTTVHHQLSRRDIFDNMRAGPGLLLARKTDLLAIQGYNSKLSGWGWEDDDVLVRLQHVLGLRREQKGAALHLTHGDDRRVLGRKDRRLSDRANFAACCRNYNNNVFVGTYSDDILSQRVAERTGNASAPRVRAPNAIPWVGSDYVPSFAAGVRYCGLPDGTRVGSPVQLDWSKHPPSRDQVLIEAAMARLISRSSGVLHVGVGSSNLARRFATRVRYVDGITLSEQEQLVAVQLGMTNYQVAMCNKYSRRLIGVLPHTAYDIIVDNNISSHACCQFHLNELMKTYAELLVPGGTLLTAEQVLHWPRGDDCWCLTSADLSYLAENVGLFVTQIGHSIYGLRRKEGRTAGHCHSIETANHRLVKEGEWIP